MKHRAFFLILGLLTLSTDLEAQEYIWPTDASHWITSSFGEYRPRRLHAALDIKTWNQTGYKIFAVRDGYIQRILVSPFGYGKAIYLKLDTGETVVYAHLQRFVDKLEKVVRQEQKTNGRYRVDRFLSASAFPVKQGEILGYTGQTGIGVPHLHFEMRDATNKPINPFRKGYAIDDRLAPIPTAVCAMPLTLESAVNHDFQPEIFTLVRLGNDRYRLPSPIAVAGEVGLAVSAYDISGGVDNRFGLYELELFVDSIQWFTIRYDRFDYAVNRHVELERDFRLKSRGFGLFYRLFQDPQNRLPFYTSHGPERGRLIASHANSSFAMLAENHESESTLATEGSSRDDSPVGIDSDGFLAPGNHAVVIQLRDFFGNTAIIEGTIVVGDTLSADAWRTSAPAPDNTGSFSLEIALTADFFDDYVRLQIQANKPLAQLPLLETTLADGSTRYPQVFGKSAETFIAKMPLQTIIGENLKITANAESREGEAAGAVFNFDNFQIKAGEKGEITSPDGQLRVAFGEGALYRDLYGRISLDARYENSRDRFMVGSVYRVEPHDVPLNGGALVTLKYPPEVRDPGKLGVYSPDSRGRWSFVDNRIDAQHQQVSARVSSLDTYGLRIDDIAPVISIGLPADELSTQSVIRLYAKDEQAGFESEESLVIQIDSEKVIGEYDPETDVVIYRPDDEMAAGEHVLNFTATDRSGNRAELTQRFVLRPH